MELSIPKGIPTIAAIQRTSVIVALAASLALAKFDSVAAALACLLGAAIVIANLFALAGVVRIVMSSAEHGGVMARLGIGLAPFKLLALLAVIYFLFTRVSLDLIGFSIGVLTQLVSIFIETGRAFWSARSNLGPQE